MRKKEINMEKKVAKSEKADSTDKGESSEDFLVSRQRYLASGIHIGMKQHTKQMRKFIYKIRPDGLAVMNLKLIDERIRIAAKFLAKAKHILVVSRRMIGHKAIDKFAEIVGCKAVKGRFMPGTLTNPKYDGFYEADVLFVLDPFSDHQAVEEAVTARIPIVAICDTFNETYNVDLVIPANNKGVKSVGTIFWLLAREILKERGEIKSDEEYKYNVDDFIKIEKKGRPAEDKSRRRRKR